MRVKLWLLMILLSLSAVFAVPQVSISSISVSDSMINQGESGVLTFVITNTGDRDFTSVQVFLSSGLILSTNSFVYSEFEVGESRLITATYSAPASLSSGDYAISISVNYNIGDSQYSNQAGAVVEVLKTNYLIVSSYTSNLIIDESNPFVINVTNQGDEALNDLLVDLLLPDGFIPTTGSQFYISSLEVEESAIFSTTIFIEKSIEPDSFQFTLIKTADDYNDTDTLNVVVNGVPEILFSGINLDPEIPVSGQAQTISVQFENIGSGKAYSVVANLILDNEVTGTTTEYLGTLDRDDLTSAIFDIINIVDGSLTGEIQIIYTDADGNGKLATQSIDFEMIQPTVDNTTTTMIGGAAIVVVGYLIYKRYKKK